MQIHIVNRIVWKYKYRDMYRDRKNGNAQPLGYRNVTVHKVLDTEGTRNILLPYLFYILLPYLQIPLGNKKCKVSDRYFLDKNYVKVVNH
jgi:hypothetical protein